MILVHCAQGDDQWKAERAGVITASMFSVIRKRVGELDEKQAAYVNAMVDGKSQAESMLLAGYKTKPRAAAIERALAGLPIGDWSDAAKDYAFRLAIERISGEPLDEGFQTWAMARGHELEPAARSAHEFAADVTVQPCGLVLTDDRAFGSSADGFIGEDGGAEYKCLIAPDRLRAVLLENDLSEFEDQMQGGMWITGRKYWHFALYCPALAPIGKELWWREWKRNDDYIEKMEADLIAFKALVDHNEAALRACPMKEAA
jgi:hypothetical protein